MSIQFRIYSFKFRDDSSCLRVTVNYGLTYFTIPAKERHSWMFSVFHYKNPSVRRRRRHHIKRLRPNHINIGAESASNSCTSRSFRAICTPLAGAADRGQSTDLAQPATLDLQTSDIGVSQLTSLLIIASLIAPFGHAITCKQETDGTCSFLLLTAWKERSNWLITCCCHIQSMCIRVHVQELLALKDDLLPPVSLKMERTSLHEFPINRNCGITTARVDTSKNPYPYRKINVDN